MSRSVVKTVLVVGDNPDTKAMEFSADKKVEKYVKYKFADAGKMREKQLKSLEAILTSDTIKLSNLQKQVYENLYQSTSEEDDEQFFDNITYGMEIDEETGDAYSTVNPKAKYQYQKCYDNSLVKTGQESEFSNPFTLKNGSKRYSAKKFDIDWNKMHMSNTRVYEAAWELCVEGRDPETELEETIKKNMENRVSYFANFKNKEEYVIHSCAFWCYGIVIDGQYHELDYRTSDKKWISEFYERFIKPLPEDILLTIYEARSLND